MGNTLKHFIIVFFTFTLWIIVFINFLGWSGLAPAMAIGYESYNWGEDTYFGYSSFMDMLASFNSAQDSASFFSGASMFDTLKHIASVALGNIPQIIAAFQNYIDAIKFSGDILQVVVSAFRCIFNLLQFAVQPFAMFMWSLVLLFQVVGFVVELLVILFMALVGTFNSKVPDILSSGINWDSYYIEPSSWDWESILSGAF